VIEVDGPVHEGQAEADAARQRVIEARGVRVIRFTNDEVLNGLDEVLRRVAAAVCGERA
jgi:leucyl-tRNA synthetase